MNRSTDNCRAQPPGAPHQGDAGGCETDLLGVAVDKGRGGGVAGVGVGEPAEEGLVRAQRLARRVKDGAADVEREHSRGRAGG